MFQRKGNKQAEKYVNQYMKLGFQQASLRESFLFSVFSFEICLLKFTVGLLE